MVIDAIGMRERVQPRAKDLKDSTAIFKRLALTRRLRDDGIARE